VQNAEREVLTPSVVLIEDGKVVVGKAALHQAIIKEENVIRWIKREMGDRDFRFQGMTPVEISAEILKKLKVDTRDALGSEVRKAVITCPAYFADPEVKNTRRAGEMAGFNVLEIVREPTAAAVYYGVDHLADGERMLVYDLGGGTFDACVLEFKDGVFRPLATLGNRQLGGHDWTMDLLGYVSRQLAESFGEDPCNDPAVRQSLYERCELAKCDLAERDSVTVPCLFHGQTAQVVVSHRTFETLTEGNILETIWLTKQVLSKTTPPLTWDDISKILLVGGSTRLRRVVPALQELTGKTPIRTGEVDTMVALGAAVLAKGVMRSRRAAITVAGGKSVGTAIAPVDFERRCPRNLGTRVIEFDEGKARIANSRIIAYGTKLPAHETRSDYAVTCTGQPYFDVPLVEFDDIGPDVVLETYRFRVRPASHPGTQIAVTFHYDKESSFAIEAKDLASGDSLAGERVEYVEPDLDTIPPPAGRRDLVFALDVSGSMAGEKLSKAKDALLETAEALFKHGGAAMRIAMLAFGSDARLLCNLTTCLADLKNAIGPLGVSGSTCMDEALERAASVLSNQEGGGLREIALVTDGMPDSQDATFRAARKAKEDGIRISAVGIGEVDVDVAFLRSIAENVEIVANVNQLAQSLPNLLTVKPGGGRTQIATWGTTK